MMTPSSLPPPPKTQTVDPSHTLAEFRCPKYSCHQPSKSSSSSSSQKSLASRTWAYLNEDVVPSTFAEIQLLLLTFCIGLQDAVSFPDFHCFASNQTGNTVFLLLAAALPEFNPSMFITANIATSLGFFLGSAYLTGQLGHLIGPRRRLWLLVTNTVQTTLVFIAAALQFGSYHTNTPGKLLFESGSIDTMEAVTGTRTLVCIALLASAAGSQVVLSRSLNMTEISTAMATAAWVDLVIDKRLMSRPLKENRGRNRRVAFLVSLAVGSLVGACIYRWVGSAVAVTVSGGGKAVVGGMFLFSRGEGREKVGDVEGGKFPSGGGDEKKSGKECVNGKEAEGNGSGSDSEAEMEPAKGRTDGNV